MNPKQVKLARAALGFRNQFSPAKSYRNYAVPSLASDDYDEWRRMEAEGWALCTTRNGVELFRLTAEGAKLALMTGERLDVEDFPELKGTQWAA